MSSTGDRVASIGELGLWVTGAVLIASAAGMRLPANLIASSSASPTPQPTAVASESASASASLAPTPTPTPAPTLSPLVRKFQAYLARRDFQFQATQTGSQSVSGANLSLELRTTGSMSYKAGDASETTKTTVQEKLLTTDKVYAGSYTYQRINDGPWVKKPRQHSDIVSWGMLFSSSRLFVDTGVETKNGSALHRLEVADPNAFSAELDTLGTITDAHVTLVFWTKDDGTPAAFRMEGTWDQPVNGAPAHVTSAQEVSFTKLSGVTITTPKNPWQWIVDDTTSIAFGVPTDWSKTDTNKAIGATTYEGPSGAILYLTFAANGLTLDQAVAAVLAASKDPAGAQVAMTVGGEPATRFGLHRSKQKDYLVEVVALHGGEVYEIAFLGSGKDTATDALAVQILATLEFTK